MLVDVLTEQGMMLARVVSQTDKEYTIQYFSKKKGDKFVYEDTLETVEAECINDHYEDDEAEKSEGYERYLKDDSDTEYEPSESEQEEYEDTSSSEDESLVTSSSDVEDF